MVLQPLFTRGSEPAPAAIFLSGAGSNARNLLSLARQFPPRDWKPVLLVTDNPERSNARAIAAEFDIPLLESDIRQFYRERGENSISLATEKGRTLRALWTEDLLKKIAPQQIRLGLLAGFIPLCNLSDAFPCLNVHPGDLTLTDDQGARVLAGLHYRPVEDVLCNPELDHFRSSVIQICPFTGNGAKEMDGGPLLGLSKPVPADRGSWTAEDLQRIRNARIKGKTPCDPLRELAEKNVEALKQQGDHQVFFPAVNAFAAGKYAVNGDQLFYRTGETSEFLPVRSVEFDLDSERPLWL